MPDASLHDRTVGTQVPTKDRLINAAAKLFTLKGYHATSIDEIASACYIQKPSFYGHFPSKEAIAVATIQNLHQYCRQSLFSILKNAQLSEQQRMQAFTEQFTQFFVERPDYALSGFLATHTINVIANLAKPIQAYFTDWQLSLQQLLQCYCPAEKAASVARISISRMQGAITMQRITTDKCYVEDISQELVAWWQSFADNH